jgi:replicative DNA helicase
MVQAKPQENNGVGAPFSEEAEQATIGGVLLDPSQFLEVATLVTTPDFFMLRHNLIWGAIERVYADKMPLDMITVSNCLEKSGDLQNIGGRAYLMQLIQSVGTAMYTPVYAELVKRTAIRRHMMIAADEMKKLAQDESLSLADVQAKADNIWLKVSSETTENDGAWIGDVASQLYDEVEALMQNRKPLSGLSTGLRDLDQLTNGIEPDTLTIIAGRPGMGKSALMDNIALNLAFAGIPVFYATSERSRIQVVRRMASIVTGINSRKFKDGQMSPHEAARFTEAIGQVSDLQIYFSDKPMPTPRDIFHHAKWMVERHKAQVILFDGMYRAKTGINEFDRDNHRKYGEIALQLKTISRSLCPVVATHQLSRGVEQRQDKRPKMSDLRESGRIEEEADKILFLYRDIMYNPATEFPNQCECILEKHRDGATGVVSTYYETTSTKFSNASIHRVDLSEL